MQDTLSSAEPMVLHHAAEGDVEIIPLPNGQFRVTLKPIDPHAYIPQMSCETTLPPDVVAAFLDHSFSFVCDFLARHDDPDYVKGAIHRQLQAYVGDADLRGKRLLDFGCGSGASTFCIGEMFPDAEVIGVELSASNIQLAERVLAARKLPNVRFLTSPDPDSLPPEIGTFDFVMLSAVYEHLLPEERRRVMPLIWSSLKDGGILFINQTPYRYFPFEQHTTGLWFINYLPDSLSYYLAKNRSKINREENRARDWNGLLRGGIRGGTEIGILRNLRLSGDGRPTIIQPLHQDRARYWLSCTNPTRHRVAKKCLAALFGLSDRLFGTVPSAGVDVVIRKDRVTPPGVQPAG